MLELEMQRMTNAKDYTTALTLFTKEGPLTAEETEKLLSLYEKYSSQGGGREFAQTALATDLLIDRTRECAGDFAALELSSGNLETLFTVKDVLTAEEDMSAGDAEEIVAAVQNEYLSKPVRIMLARAALDRLVIRRNYVQFRTEIAALAAFLTNCDTEELDRYTLLVGEIRWKCNMNSMEAQNGEEGSL